jgi:nucleotide-binding universal stress UspA family protein
MKRFHNIVVGTDFTPSCRVALKEAFHRAAADGAAITIVHSMDEFLVHELTRALSTTKEKIREDWADKLRTFVTESDIGGPFTVEVRIGNAVAELMEVCKEKKADLLVMGAKGSRNAPHRIGAVASKCIRSAPVDVLVVRAEAAGPYRKVLACVDFSENSAKAVQYALHVAQEDKGQLDCLYVFQSAMSMAIDYGGFAPISVDAAVDAEGVKRWEHSLTDFLEPLTRKAEGTKITPVVVERINIREAILDYVIEHKSDLVVLGTRGKSNLRSLLIGTTAERLVQHLPCSILAVKPDEIVDAALGCAASA